VQLHYSPVHLQPYYRRLGFGEGDFPYAETYAHNALSLPLYPGLQELEQEWVVQTLRNCLEQERLM
jgi:dTDP-4-amino-4,6-dideoxygalactose transaminase